MRNCIFFLSMICVLSSQAAVKTYQETDNEGMSKPERFTSIEKHLIELTDAINHLEVKLNENSKKFSGLEEVVKSIKSDETKRIQSQLGEKNNDNKKNGNDEEIKKLKADILSLKNQDIEKIKLEIQDISQVVKHLQNPAH